MLREARSVVKRAPAAAYSSRLGSKKPRNPAASFYESQMSTLRAMHGGVADRAGLAKGPNGRALCRWCALEVPSRRSTFCSAWCVHEWRLRSDPGYLRQQVFLRDHGVCALCGIDTCAAYFDLKRARGTRRRSLLAQWGLNRLSRKTLWDADHIQPVAEGGGECDLSNIRTLCLICHRRETLALRARLRAKEPVPC